MYRLDPGKNGAWKMEENWTPGRIYPDCDKEKKYQILTIARDRSTQKEMVVYQELFGSFAVFVESREAFGARMKNETAGTHLKETALRSEAKPDSGKTPEAEPIQASESRRAGQETEEIHPLFRRFLEADGYAQQMEILRGMGDVVDDTMINSIAVMMDLEIQDGPVEQRFQELLECIGMKQRYEIERY
jgi:hypothetical protein